MCYECGLCVCYRIRTPVFHISVISLCFLLDQLCRRGRQVRLLFFFRLATIMRTEKALKVSPINHDSNQASLAFICTYEPHNPHVYMCSKRHNRNTGNFTSEKIYIIVQCPHFLRRAHRRTHTHTQLCPAVRKRVCVLKVKEHKSGKEADNQV